MILTIYEALKAKGLNPVYYGETVPPAPYTVISPGKDPLERGTIFIITSHVEKKQLYLLDENVKKVVAELKSILWYDTDGFDPSYFAGNSDGTLSRETTFLLVSKY